MKYEIQAPVIGSYEVQECPVCHVPPVIDVTIDRKDKVESIDYKLRFEVYCSCCGLASNSIDTWNRLKYSEK